MPVNLGHWVVDNMVYLGRHFALFLMLALALFILQRLVFALSEKIFGGKVIYFSAWLGTPIHELSHAFVCLIFGHKIQRLVLFNPDSRGTLGYVNHAYNNRSIWQVMGNFFIGIAPLFGGLLALYLVTWGMLDDSKRLLHLLTSIALKDLNYFQPSQLLTLNKELVVFLKEAYLSSPYHLLLWAYFCAAISLHLFPSKEDLKGAWVGFVLFISLCLVIMLLNEVLVLNWFTGVKNFINMASMLYLIGIVLASLLVLFLFIFRFLLSLFRI